MLHVTEASGAQDPSPSDGPLVKLLKSGRVPEARQGTVIDMIGKRGAVGDLDFIYQQAMTDRFSARGPDQGPRRAGRSRVEPRPEADQDRDKLIRLIQRAALRHGRGPGEVGGPAGGSLEARGGGRRASDASLVAATTEEGLRASAIEALAAIGGQVGRCPDRGARRTGLARGRPAPGRRRAGPAGCRTPPRPRSRRADPQGGRADGVDLKPLMAAFLNRQGGGEVLAAAIGRHTIPADSAKLSLRAVYALGHADPALVGGAGPRRGHLHRDQAARRPPSSMPLVAEVAAKGDPARGEAVFRRNDLNCMSCHSVSKAGGDVGPDLSSIGQTSPSDYIINSILVPDQSIKEQYHTLVVQTTDGQVFQGIVTDKDDQRIVLKECHRGPRVVPVASIEDQKPGGSLMPKGLVNLMTRAEFVDLVRFLSELGKPGPYAIRDDAQHPALARAQDGFARAGRRGPAPESSATRSATCRPTAGPRPMPRSPARFPWTKWRPPRTARSSTSRAS